MIKVSLSLPSCGWRIGTSCSKLVNFHVLTDSMVTKCSTVMTTTLHITPGVQECSALDDVGQ